MKRVILKTKQNIFICSSKLKSSCNETARTIKDDTTQEDKTKNLLLAKLSSETNQDKRLLHKSTSECESYETTSDEKNEIKIPSEEYRYTTMIILSPNDKEKKKWFCTYKIIMFESYY